MVALVFTGDRIVVSAKRNSLIGRAGTLQAVVTEAQKDPVSRCTKLSMKPSSGRAAGRAFLTGGSSPSISSPRGAVPVRTAQPAIP